MKSKKVVVLVSIICFTVSLFLLLKAVNLKDLNSIIGAISGVFGILGSVWSLFMPSTYSYEFHTSDWVEKAEREWVLIVNKNKHGMGNKPKIQILMKNEDGFEEVIASHQFNDKGDITIGASKGLCCMNPA
ncbi:MAG: hypothetical protein H6577_24405 [Lewinellaceae bacterium]|nr:hypothetical protein [Lewinellaceae bacterium]